MTPTDHMRSFTFYKDCRISRSALTLIPAVFACLSASEAADRDLPVSRESPRLEVVRTDDGVTHVRVVMHVYRGEEEFDVLALHRRNENGHSMEVGVIVEERSDNLLDAWLHVVDSEELHNYSFHVFYTVPFVDETSEETCRREYVLEPAKVLRRD